MNLREGQYTMELVRELLGLDTGETSQAPAREKANELDSMLAEIGVALLLFALTIGKVFLFDMAGLREFYRILAFLVVAMLRPDLVGAVGDSDSPATPAGSDDGDGDEDVLRTNFDLEDNSLHLNDGTGQFTSDAAGHGLAQPSRDRLGWGGGFFDVDLDGDLDVAVGMFEVPVAVYLNEGDGTLVLGDSVGVPG